MRKVIIISIWVLSIAAILSFAVIVKDIQKYKRLRADLDLKNYKESVLLKVDFCFSEAVDSANYYQVKARYWMNEGNIDSFVKYIRKAEYHLGRMESAYQIEKKVLTLKPQDNDNTGI